MDQTQGALIISALEGIELELRLANNLVLMERLFKSDKALGNDPSAEPLLPRIKEFRRSLLLGPE